MPYSYNDTDPFGTHVKILERYIRHTTGDILEFGTGNNSTGLILECIKGTNRRLVSIENNAEWLTKMVAEYPPNLQHSYLKLEMAEFPALRKALAGRRFSICFVDSSPWESRVFLHCNSLETSRITFLFMTQMLSPDKDYLER